MLAGYAGRYNPNGSIIPLCVDTERYVPLYNNFSEGRELTIGWSGSFSQVRQLELVTEALRHIAQRYPIRLLLIGAPAGLAIPGVPTESRPWSERRELDELRAIEVGNMPLFDDPSSRAKGGLKAIQYMGLAIPTVVSPVGINADIVQDGENGLQARCASEWVEKLSRLLESAELRARLGRAARRTSEQSYPLKVVAPKVCDIFADVASYAASRRA